ncbi:MAG: cellulose-binding domain-containing protein [Actinomycetia bacterium]|nr:cellulose-binding domain-containing protein [Actinomycetes bacterium]
MRDGPGGRVPLGRRPRPGGFQADLAVANTGANALNGWTLTWTLGGDHIVNAWNGTVTPSGRQVTARDAGRNAAPPSGGSVDIGRTASCSAGDAPRHAFALNGTSCATA